MTPYVRAIAAAFSQQWQQQLTLSSTLAPLLSSASLAIGVGWIADRLFITSRTVALHVSNLLAKLNARNRTHAVEVARLLGL